MPCKKRLIPGTPEYEHRRMMRKTYNAKRSKKSSKHKCTPLCRHKDRKLVARQVIQEYSSDDTSSDDTSFNDNVKEFLATWRGCHVWKCNAMLQHNPTLWQPVANYLHYDPQYVTKKEVDTYLLTIFNTIDDI